MTNKEAIEIIKQLPLVRHEALTGTTSDMGEALRIAIDALEKQVPKKPIENDEDGWFVCPTCNGVVTPYYCGRPHHCHCGQAISWTEDNNE